MSDTASATSADNAAAFPHTRWSVVLAAARTPSSGSERALEELCRTYWFPLYAFVRQRGHTKQDAEDLTQEFFRRLLEGRWIENVDREKGRLRSFLITALKHFLTNEWRRASAQKRGGQQIHVPMDTTFAEGRYAADPSPELAPEAVFDRQWAMTLLDLSMKRLETEFADAGKPSEFAVLKDCLAAAHGAINYPAVAAGLGVNEGAARVTVHRLRKRFREVYRQEVAQTLSPGADLKEELKHLAGSLVK